MDDEKLLSALAGKRADLVAEVADLERRLADRRAALGQLDATIRTFLGGIDMHAVTKPKGIGISEHFAPREITQRCQDALRNAAGGTVTTEAIVNKALSDKGAGPEMHKDFRRRFRWSLTQMCRKGAAARVGRDGWRLIE